MKGTKKIQLQAKLIKSYIVVALIISISSILSCICMAVMSSRYANALTDYGFAQGDIGKMMTAFADLRSNTRAMIGYEDPSLVDSCRKDYEKKREDFEEYMADVEKGIVTREARETFVSLQSVLEKYFEVEAKVQELGSSDDPEIYTVGQEMAYNDMAPLYSEAYGYMEDMLDVKETKGDDLKKTLEMAQIIVIAFVVVLILSSFLIAFKLGSSIAKGIAVPLGKLAKRLEHFAKGDLKSEFPTVNSDDEVADMTKSAVDMAATLRSIIADMHRILDGFSNGDWTVTTADSHMYQGDFNALTVSTQELQRRINETLNNINGVSGQVSDGAGGLAGAAQSVAEGATEQAEAVEALEITINKVTEGIHHTAQKTQESYEQAREYSSKADSSREEMEKLVKVMGRISETSRKIGNIISDIEDIASQTNMLSLNASIEAARAGEAGRGFAVVADQIGKLAAQSAKSAIDTRNLIEGALKEIEEGNSTAGHAEQSIGEVVEGVGNIAKTASELFQISSEQAESVEQLEYGIHQISEIVQSNSAAAEKLSETSEEMLAQSETMNGLIRQFILR